MNKQGKKIVLSPPGSGKSTLVRSGRWPSVVDGDEFVFRGLGDLADRWWTDPTVKRTVDQAATAALLSYDGGGQVILWATSPDNTAAFAAADAVVIPDAASLVRNHKSRAADPTAVAQGVFSDREIPVVLREWTEAATSANVPTFPTIEDALLSLQVEEVQGTGTDVADAGGTRGEVASRIGHGGPVNPRPGRADMRVSGPPGRTVKPTSVASLDGFASRDAGGGLVRTSRPVQAATVELEGASDD